MKRQYYMIILMVVMATMLSACDNNTKNGEGSTKATKETYDFVKEDTTTSAEQGDINNEDQQDDWYDKSDLLASHIKTMDRLYSVYALYDLLKWRRTELECDYFIVNFLVEMAIL